MNLSYKYRFFKSDVGNSGPKAFVEFVINNKQFILIGDHHGNLTPEEIRKYMETLKAFSSFVYAIQSHKVKIFAELMPNTVYATQGFINNLTSLPTDHLEVILSDDRIRFAHFYNFNMILSILIADAKGNPKIDFYHAFNQLKTLMQDCDTFSGFKSYVQAQQTHLQALIKRHENSIPQLKAFLNDCFVNIDNSCKEVVKLEQEYFAYYNDTQFYKFSMAEIIGDMIKKTQNTTPLLPICKIINDIFLFTLDASLACKLCDELNAPDTSTTIVSAGLLHVVNLSRMLINFAEPKQFYIKKDNDHNIKPHALQTYLEEAIIHRLQSQTSRVPCGF